jgi:glycosyltransferase involved in cell wall biosynthesis
MRIAFVAPFGLRAKGTTRARALPLAEALAAWGHEVALFVPPYDSQEDSGKHWEQGRVEVINMPLPRFRTNLDMLAHLGLTWRLLLAVRNWKPDLVHVFKPKGPSGLVGTALWLLGARSRDADQGASSRRLFPSLVVDSDDWEGRDGWNDDPRAGYSLPARRFFAWQESYGLSHAHAWTVTSACLRDRAIRFGADPARVFVLHNGVPERSTPHHSADLLGGEDEPLPLAISGQPSVVLYTRFAGVRAQDVTAIWNRVRAIVPDARLTVLGRGLAREEETLRDVPGIDVLGWVDPAELLGQLAAAQVAVVPWVDTPSNRARHSAKVLELMQAGLPIVAYDVGELATTVGEAGALVEPGDEANFARAVVALLSDPQLACRLGAAARRRVLERFTWERLVAIATAAYRTAETAAGDFRESHDRPGEIDAARKTNVD